MQHLQTREWEIVRTKKYDWPRRAFRGILTKWPRANRSSNFAHSNHHSRFLAGKILLPFSLHAGNFHSITIWLEHMIVVNKTTVAPPPPITVNFKGLQNYLFPPPLCEGLQITKWKNQEAYLWPLSWMFDEHLMPKKLPLFLEFKK